MKVQNITVKNLAQNYNYNEKIEKKFLSSFQVQKKIAVKKNYEQKKKICAHTFCPK